MPLVMAFRYGNFVSVMKGANHLDLNGKTATPQMYCLLRPGDRRVTIKKMGGDDFKLWVGFGWKWAWI